MPGRDGTGPLGSGSMSGRGLGFCTGVNTGGYGTRIGRGVIGGLGLGLGLIYGCRRGYRRFFSDESIGLSDKEILAGEKEILQQRLKLINKELGNLSESND